MIGADELAVHDIHGNTLFGSRAPDAERARALYLARVRRCGFAVEGCRVLAPGRDVCAALWREGLRRRIRAEARGDLRDTPTAVLLSDLRDCRLDIAPHHPDGRARHLPPWWTASAVKAGMIRRVLVERGEA